MDIVILSSHHVVTQFFLSMNGYIISKDIQWEEGLEVNIKLEFDKQNVTMLNCDIKYQHCEDKPSVYCL